MRNIVFHKETKTFHLYNDQISYIMCVLENGHMGQIYYGKKIHDKKNFSLSGGENRTSDDLLCI